MIQQIMWFRRLSEDLSLIPGDRRRDLCVYVCVCVCVCVSVYVFERETVFLCVVLAIKNLFCSPG